MSVAAGEPLEDVGLHSGGTPGTVVAHGQPDLTVVGDDARPHDGAGRGVGTRVAEQVGDDLVQPRRVALDLDRLVGQVELPDVVGGGGVGVADRVDDHLGEVDGLVVERAAGVQAGEQQQVVDQRGHPDRLGLDAADRVGDACGHRLLLATGQLRIPTDRGERGAQLVAGVGDELAYPLLALLALVEGVVDVVEHLVERGADLTDLGASVGVLRRDPLDDVDLALGQRKVRDSGRRGGDAVERAEVAPDQPHAADADDDETRQHSAGDSEPRVDDRRVLSSMASR